ncbi:S8 family serine peptidase, partial [bacterium]|nr:S8 family serine peptidase [bacterium]
RQSNSQKSAIINRMMSSAGPATSVRVIIGLEDTFTPPGLLNTWQRGRQRDKIRKSQDKFTGKLRRGKFIEKRRFKDLPFIAIEINSDELEQLKSMSDVSSVEEDLLSRPTLASSNAVIGSPAAWEEGYDGNSQVIAILDTGVDASHPYFSTDQKIVSEACFSTNSAGQGATSACPGGATSSTAVGSGGVCSTADCDHGTHVAGIAAGNDLTGPNYGVARGADLISVQVFSDFVNSSLCGSSRPCSLSYSSDQIAALEHIYTLRNDFDIAAVNMSLGAGSYTSYCDVSQVARKAAIDSLRSVDIATIIASGNGGKRNALQAPACISSAISVGATSDGDALASFSNVSDFISLLAPGISIRSAVPGGGTANFSGTSMAVPQVAGAWAVLKQQQPDASVDEVLQSLYETGTSIDDNRSGGQVADMRRINVDLAASLEAPDAEPKAEAGTAYSPIPGCRVVDTREGGYSISPLVENYFLAGRSGQNLSAQGGSIPGCGIPSSATAIQVNITVITQGSAGYLRAWPSGELEPNATVLAWDGGATSNAFSLPLCSNNSCGSDFSVKLYGNWESVGLVVDVFGYYAQ